MATSFITNIGSSETTDEKGVVTHITRWRRSCGCRKERRQSDGMTHTTEEVRCPYHQQNIPLNRAISEERKMSRLFYYWSSKRLPYQWDIRVLHEARIKRCQDRVRLSLTAQKLPVLRPRFIYKSPAKRSTYTT